LGGEFDPTVVRFSEGVAGGHHLPGERDDRRRVSTTVSLKPPGATEYENSIEPVESA
jgi:hypothetical protein